MPSLTQSWSGSDRWNHLKAPQGYHRARLEYADGVLARAKKEFRPQDINILKSIYAPIIDKAKRTLERRHGHERRSDIDDAVEAEFMHMLQMYDGSRERPLKFPNFLKNYFEGWCQRHLMQMTTGTKRGPKFINSSSFEDDQGSHLDLVAGSALIELDAEGSVDVKDVIKTGFDHVRKMMDEKAVDALLFSCLYNYTHVEISELLGCTQARVSQMLAKAKEFFIKRIRKEDDYADIRPDIDGKG